MWWLRIVVFFLSIVMCSKVKFIFYTYRTEAMLVKWHGMESRKYNINRGWPTFFFSVLSTISALNCWQEKVKVWFLFFCFLMSSGKYFYKHGKRRIFEQEWEYLYENTLCFWYIYLFIKVNKSIWIEVKRV